MLIFSSMELMALVVLAFVCLSSGQKNFKESVQETSEVGHDVNEPQNLKEDEVTKVLQKAVTGDKKDEMIRRLVMDLQKKTEEMNQMKKKNKVLKKTNKVLKKTTQETRVENEELRERVYEQQRGKRLSNVTRAAGFNNGDFVKLNPSSKSYFLSKTEVTWIKAKSMCKQLGGELARLWNDEHQYIYKQILKRNIPACPASGRPKCDVWLGGSPVNGKWTWYSGEPVTTQLSQWYDGTVSAATPGNYLRAHQHMDFQTFHFESSPGSSSTNNVLCQINSY